MTERFSLKREVRQRRTIELHVQGATIPEIVQRLATENIKASERTVFRDLHSQMAEDYLSPFGKELIRKQNRDIESAPNLGLRLKARDRLIGRVLPRRQIIKTEIKGSPTTDAGDAIHSLLEKVFTDDAHAIIQHLNIEKTGPVREAPQ
jgi:hypothetical protein